MSVDRQTDRRLDENVRISRKARGPKCKETMDNGQWTKDNDQLQTFARINAHLMPKTVEKAPEMIFENFIGGAVVTNIGNGKSAEVSMKSLHE